MNLHQATALEYAQIIRRIRC